MESTKRKSFSTDEMLTINKIDKSKKEEIIQEKDEQEEQEKIEENLMFDKKHISIFKLYCHISGTLEIILSVIAIIMTLGAGGALLKLVLLKKYLEKNCLTSFSILLWKKKSNL